MVYREGRDPQEVAAEVWIEAQRREVFAARDKVIAEADLQTKQAKLEMTRARLGAVTALSRHVEALLEAEARAAASTLRSEVERAELERIERERAAFLRSRGVDPGPALDSVVPPPRESLEREALRARQELEDVKADLVEAERELEAGRAAFEAAVKALARASQSRLAAEAELRALGR